MIFTLSFKFRYYYMNKYGMIHPSFRILNKLDVYLIREYEENLPKNLLDWIYHPSEEKTKEEIMKAINPNKEHTYVVKSERNLPDNQKTVFKVRYLTMAEQAEIRDSLYNVRGVGKARSERFQTGTADLETLKKGLKGWENFTDEEGKPLTFNASLITEMLNLIPPDARSELAAHIRGESEVSEGEE